MPHHFYTLSGSRLALGSKIGKGGEGTVYEVVGFADLVAKNYTDGRADDRRDKIEAMVAAEPHRQAAHISFPIDVLLDEKRRFVGFTMRKMEGARPIHQLWGSRDRQEKFPDATVAFMTRVAANAARAVAELHHTGCVIGDINESGFLVTDQATVVLIDSDSIQYAAGGLVFPCVVGTPEYLPPEHQGINQRQLGPRDPNHDAFGLAVMIFRLLMNGTHPFMGVWHGHGDPPALPKWIEAFRYAYGPDSDRMRVGPQPTAPPIDWLPDEIRDAFDQAFGSPGVQKRSTASDWIGMLDRLQANLVVCHRSRFHHHRPGTRFCPWCETERKRGQKLFGPPKPGFQQKPYGQASNSGAATPTGPSTTTKNPLSASAHGTSPTPLPRPAPPPKTSNIGAIYAVLTIAGAIATGLWLFSGDEKTVSAPTRLPAEVAEQQRLQVEARRQAREAVLRSFDFGQWRVGQSLKNTHNRSLSFCTRPCGRGATGRSTIRLVSITKTSAETISLKFSIRTTDKNKYLPGRRENRAKHDYLLFVSSDYYTTIGYIDKTKFLHAGAMHIVDGNAKKYKSIGGIKGLRIITFNKETFRAVLPFQSMNYFSVLFPIPTTTTNSLKFVFPRIHGHQNGWYWIIYEVS